MIHDNIKIFSQNVWKNLLIVNTILETYSQFDIIFIKSLHSPSSIQFQVPLIAKEKF